jgi:hypothetical protein
MSCVILTSLSGLQLKDSGRADTVIPFAFRFVGGPLPSLDELAFYVAARSEKHDRGSHWSDLIGGWHDPHKDRRDLGLAEFCQQYETVELWFDPNPNDQLHLIWLLDFFSAYSAAAVRLKIRFVDYELIRGSPEELKRWRVPAVDATIDEFHTASATWQAYRSATPQASVSLLGQDLSALPLLRPALLDLVEELPSIGTGLGATEMRLLELIARGYALTNALFYLSSLRQRRVFNQSEIGSLLEGLAHGPTPAVAGLDDELRDKNYLPRDEAYRRSLLSLTEFGWAIVAHKEDFSRCNPIDRWWGGARLTNDFLWRWNPALVAPQPSQPLSSFQPGATTHPSRTPL